LSYAMKVAPEGATQVPILPKTMRVRREAVRHVVDYVIRTKQTGLVKVHHALYRLLRERYGLPARLAIDASRVEAHEELNKTKTYNVDRGTFDCSS